MNCHDQFTLHTAIAQDEVPRFGAKTWLMQSQERSAQFRDHGWWKDACPEMVVSHLLAEWCTATVTA